MGSAKRDGIRLLRCFASLKACFGSLKVHTFRKPLTQHTSTNLGWLTKHVVQQPGCRCSLRYCCRLEGEVSKPHKPPNPSSCVQRYNRNTQHYIEGVFTHSSSMMADLNGGDGKQIKDLDRNRPPGTFREVYVGASPSQTL